MFYIGALAMVLNLISNAHSWHEPADVIKTACQGQWLNIDCPIGQGINIKSANYGRLPGQYVCGSYGLVSCIAQNSLQAVRSKCQGEGWCKIPVTEEFFGDQCKGTGIYLHVQYTCDYPLTNHKFTCQDDTLSIDCKSGHYIDIYHALFGRVHGNAVCQTDPYWLKSVHCVSGSGVYNVKNECQGKRWCKVPATVEVFGDPCPGTSKYLFVRYRCEEISASRGSSGGSTKGSSSGGSPGSSSRGGSSSSGKHTSSSGQKSSRSESRSGSGSGKNLW